MRVRSKWRSVALTLTGAVALGGGLCVPEPEPEEEAPSSLGKFIQATCDRAIRCEDVTGKAYIDEAACVDFWTDTFECGIEINLGFTQMTIDFEIDESVAAECITWLETSDCDVLDDANNPCSDIAVNPTAYREGDSCQSDAGEIRVCGLGLYCDDDQAEGVCSVCLREARAGEACSFDPEIPCDDASYCDTSDNLCAALKGNGSSCINGDECISEWCRQGTCTAQLDRDTLCEPGDHCRDSLRCHEGICTDRVAPGQACNGDRDCLLPAVCAGQVCVQVDLCTPAELGQPCLFRCAEGSICRDRQCVGHLGEGEACSSNIECGFPAARCSAASNTCRAFAELGSSCGATQPCRPMESYCDMDSDPANPVCAEAKAEGVACGNQLECQSVHCDPVSDTCAYPSDTCTMP